MLKLIDAKKSYNSQLILQVPILNLENGIYWVKGANGSGKSTFLKMVAALLPFEGDIVCNGISLKSDPLVYRQDVSWAQAEPLYPAFMSGMDLIFFCLEFAIVLTIGLGFLPFYLFLFASIFFERWYH